MIPFLKRRSFGALLAAGALAVTASQAHAAFVLTLAQAGANVTLTGTGTLNTTALTKTAGGGTFVGIAPFSDTATAGIDTSFNTLYSGISGPANFGTGGNAAASSSTGTVAGLNVPGALIIATSYVSGTLLTNSATFNNKTISSLGATPGTYTYTWGTGANADSLTLVVAGVPEPSTWASVAAGAGLLGFVLRRRAVRA